MSIEISIPFRVNPDGSIATETDPDVQINQHVMGLVNTEPGERAALGNYGVPLADMLFEDVEEVGPGIVTDVTTALNTYEPGVQLLNASVLPEITNGQDGMVQVQIDFARGDSPTSAVAPTNQNTAVIGIDGKVTEVVRG